MKVETITINEVDFSVKIYYENRKNIRATIRNQIINVRIPIGLSKKEKTKKLKEILTWAKQKIIKNPEKFMPKPVKEYKNNDKLIVGNKQYTLNISYKDKKSSSAKINNNIIHLCLSSNLSKQEENKHISTLISRSIASNRLSYLEEKINTLNKKHFKQKINKISFKNHKTKWGSCSKAGNINISTRLLFAPDDILKYVCIHELAHLIEHNHSKDFWNIVEKAMPDYKDKKRWLKENGNSLLDF